MNGFDPNRVPTPQDPQEFGPYLVIGKLGQGGMGKVYLAVERAYDRRVALKITDPVADLSDEELRRFEAEANSMKQLTHQNIIQVYAYGIIGNRQYIAMRLVDGPTLREKIRRGGRLEAPQVVDYAKQIARGLLFAHRKGVVHRDVKPSNILIDEDDRLVISDFGISYRMDGGERLTSPGMAMGTPEYMSPEQCQGGKITELSDLYSFGIILYEMIAGEPPFTGPNPMSTAYKQVHDAPPALSEVRSGFPAQLSEIVSRCLAKEPDRRYQSMGEVLKALDGVQFGAVDNLHKKLSAWGKESLEGGRLKRKGEAVEKAVRSHGLFLLGIALCGLLVWCGTSLFLSARHGSFGILRATISMDDARVKALEDGNPATFVAIPSDAGGNWHSLAVDFVRPKLVYTLAVTSRSTDSATAAVLRQAVSPVSLRLENERGQIRNVELPRGLPGAVYVPVDPFPARMLTVRLFSAKGETSSSPMALCDLAFIGLDL